MTDARASRLLQAGMAMTAIFAWPALAQASSGQDKNSSAAIEQIPGTPVVVVPLPRPPRTSAPPPQLTAETESSSPAEQLTSELRPSPAAAQIYKGRRTAQPSEPLSQPADGRTAAVERVEGKDRCDPAANKGKASRDCRNVIETRAAEFTRPDTTPLSPEQRIIIQQQLRDRGSTADSAARLLAIGTIDANRAEDQAVASIVLRKPPEPPKEKKPDEEPTAAEQAAAALVNAIMNQPPRP